MVMVFSFDNWSGHYILELGDSLLLFFDKSAAIRAAKQTIDAS